MGRPARLRGTLSFAVETTWAAQNLFEPGDGAACPEGSHESR